MTGGIQKWRIHLRPKIGELRNGAKTKAGPLEAEQLSRLGNIHVCDWSDSEILDSLAFGELRFRSKTKAGPLEAEQLSRLGNIALVR